MNKLRQFDPGESGPHVDAAIKRELRYAGIPFRVNSTMTLGEIPTYIKPLVPGMELVRLTSTWRISDWVPMDLVFHILGDFPEDITLGLHGWKRPEEVFPWHEADLVTPHRKVVCPISQRSYLTEHEGKVFAPYLDSVEAQFFIRYIRFRSADSLKQFWKMALKRGITNGWNYFSHEVNYLDDQAS